MKIGLQTWGSDGDINPFIALAGGLAAEGHEVTLAITAVERKDYGQYAERLKFQLAPVLYIANSEEDLMLFSAELDYIVKPIDQVRIIVQELMERGIQPLYETAQSLSRDNDLLVGHFILNPLQLAAEKAGKPYVTVTLNHGAIPSRTIPPPMLPNLGPWLNPLSWMLAVGVLNRIMLPGINRLRVSEGVRSVHTFREVIESPLCNLIAVSRAFCTRQCDWAGHQHCAAVVHHGGAGTTQTSLSYGIPSVIVAHIADQYFGADELKRLGVAPNRLDRRSATPESIAQAIRQALDTPAMQNRAKNLGRQLATENGVAKAVEIITQMDKKK
ncbi:MAG: glycosyltransferase [Candidatus Methylumidiphilus sp.]